jgi:DNA-directed RNA polymerase specialized sigma24 family protein
VPNAEFARGLDPHRGCLLRVAQLQRRDAAFAADVAQETLLAALPGSSFSGKSTLRARVTGILKHRIVNAVGALLQCN